MNVVEIENLTLKLGSKIILKDVSLTLRQSEIMAIVGPNGGGKTTLIKTVLGFYKPSKGKVLLFGKPPKKVKKGLIGYLPQKDLINYNFPILVKDVVLMGRKALKPPFSFLNDNDYEVCEEALALVGMREFSDYSFGQLSGGQKQRVLIARLLAMEPKLLIFDEPSTGLDVVGQNDFYELINKLKIEKNISILMVTHDIGVISSYVDTIACLNKTIHYHGPPEEGKVAEALKEVFGENIQLVVHDSRCVICKEFHKHD